MATMPTSTPTQAPRATSMPTRPPTASPEPTVGVDRVLIQLTDPLDEPEYYCVDVPGAGRNVRLQSALQGPPLDFQGWPLYSQENFEQKRIVCPHLTNCPCKKLC